MSLEENTKEVTGNIAGYIAYKAQEYCKRCCYDKLFCVYATTQNSIYIKIFSRGRLKIPSEGLSEWVAPRFAILDASSDHM